MSRMMSDQVPTREPHEIVPATATSEEIARRRAIAQIQRRHQFQFEILTSAIIMMLVAVIWAVAEYNNAGGWPTDGFSQSSGIHDVWNLWIIYPFMAWVIYLAVRTWAFYRGAAISEREIQLEMERQVRTR